MGCGASSRARLEDDGSESGSAHEPHGDGHLVAYMQALVLEARRRRHRVGDTLAAPDVFGSVLPTYVMTGAALFASFTYMRVDLAYAPCTAESGVAARPTNVDFLGVPLREPFGAASALCYAAAGLAVPLVSAANRAYMYPPLYTVCVALVMLGVAGAVSHAQGSPAWSAATVTRLAAFRAAAVALISVCLQGLYGAALGRPTAPSDPVPAAFNAATLVGVALCLVTEPIDVEEPLLVAAAAAAVGCNGLQKALQAFRSLREDKARVADALGAAGLNALTVAVPRAVVLGAAIALRRAHGFAVDADLEARGACDQHGDGTQALAAAMQRLDWLQGAWHYLSACAFASAALSAQEGIGGFHLDRTTGRGETGRARRIWLAIEGPGATYAEEVLARLVLAGLATLVLLLDLAGSGVVVWKYLWLSLSALFLPWWALLSASAVLGAGRPLVQRAEDLVRQEEEELRAQEQELARRIQESEPMQDLVSESSPEPPLITAQPTILGWRPRRGRRKARAARWKDKQPP